MIKKDGLFKRIFAVLDAGLKTFIFLCGIGLFFSVVIQVFFRYVLNNPLFWPQETATYLMVWGIFLSCYYAYIDGSHVRVSFLVDKMPRNSRNVINLLMNVLVLVFLLVVVWEGINLSMQFIGIKSPMLRIPRLVPFLSIPIGSVLMVSVAIKNIVLDIKNFRLSEQK